MDADEKDVYRYLENYNGQYVSVKEICRRASTKKRFAKEPDWAREVLKRMADHHLVESDIGGRYRIKEDHKHKDEHLSEDTARIIEEGGQQGQTGIQIDMEDED